MEFEILIIAMRRETERRAAIQNMMQSLGVSDYQFLDATDGKEMAQLADVRGYDAIKACEVRGRELSTSEIACFDSHRRSWEWVAKRDKPVLILESDAQIDAHTLEVCRALCARRGKDLPSWQHVMLYYDECMPSFRERRKITGAYQLVRFANPHVYLASSMLLTPDAAAQFLKHGQDIYLPADDFMTGGYVNKGVELYAVYPAVATLSWTKAISNIAAERTTLDMDMEANRKRRHKSPLRKYGLWMRQVLRKTRTPHHWL